MSPEQLRGEKARKAPARALAAFAAAFTAFAAVLAALAALAIFEAADDTFTIVITIFAIMAAC